MQASIKSKSLSPLRQHFDYQMGAGTQASKIPYLSGMQHASFNPNILIPTSSAMKDA
jgi:hypothetical protein